MADHKSSTDRSEGELLTRERAKTKRPPMYAVILLNDDYTPMDFVVWILQTVFYKTNEEALALMLSVHNDGRGLCGVYTHDVARTKALQVDQFSRKHEHPLECVIEPCDDRDEERGDG